MAAGIEKSRQLRDLAAGQNGHGTDLSSLPPYVGIAVVGHVWDLHLASKEADGAVVSLTLLIS